MGFINGTAAGKYRAFWRDTAGRQRSKTFDTKRAANAFLAETEAALHHGTYVDPRAGRLAFGPYATRWLAARSQERTTAARDRSMLRTHLVPRWGAVPLSRIGHSDVQAWVTELGGRLSPATVRECFRLMSGVMRSALRDRLVGHDPCEGVQLPKRHRKNLDGLVITPAELVGRLLPAVPERHRALVALAGGTGLRWGECVGLRWGSVNLRAGTVRVVRVAVEVAGTVTVKEYPKTKAGVRTVPLPAFVVAQLRGYRAAYGAGPAGEVFRNSAGGPLRRTLFRARVWRPALVRAGLLGRLVEKGPYKYLAYWRDTTGLEHSAEFTTEREAVAKIARHAANGMRFHDLRHSYATWLVSQGVPVNSVQRAMGHERASTTLDRYTHRSAAMDDNLRAALAAFSLHSEPEEADEEPEDDPEQPA